MSDIQLGGDAAVMGGVHSDSHNVETHNSTTNTTHNNTVTDNSKTINTNVVHQAQLTDTQIRQDNEKQFLQAVMAHMQNGILDQRELAEITQLSLQWHIQPERANQIIDQVRKSASIINGSQGNEYLAGQILQEVFNAIQQNEVEILKHKFRTLEQLARTSADGNVQCYYHLLLASLYPENSVVAFINSRTDNYWQLFWVHVAYVKLGNADNAVALLPRLGGFGAPQGDVALLMALDNLADYRRNNNQTYYKQQVSQYLNDACQAGMSEAVSGLWYAAKEMLENDVPQPEDWFRFYCEQTLKEMAPAQKQVLEKSASAMPAPPPPMPKFNAQSVQLNQSQGFNPLQAARQMGMGQMTTVEQMQQQMQQMQQNFGQMQQAFSAKLNGYAQSNMPSMPNMPQNVQKGAEPPPPMPAMPQQPMPDVQEAVQPEMIEQYGVLFTNSVKLARKYGCQPTEVYAVLNQFIQQSEPLQMHWYLFDAANNERLNDSDYWGDYNDALESYLQQNGFTLSVATPVWIIGGGDVIPVPQINDPLYSNSIPTDMAYCYYTGFFDDLWDGDHKLVGPRNTISRLPLEEGEMQTNIADDLGSYFNLCAMTQGEIKVDDVTMASNVAWRDNSVTMSHHLPLLHVDTPDVQEVDKGMYLCPKLVSPNVQSVFNEQAYNDYMKAAQQCGMLLFNLHGGDGVGDSGFYGEDHGSCVESFNLDMLKQSNGRVLNTVACFGARFMGYERNDSMLLSSMLGGGYLLYAGSSVSVPMIGDDEQEWPAGTVQYPGSGSEKFMPVYCYYQFCGLPAGQAMMQAKMDYFNTFRHMERDDFSLSTIIMFGLYGNPMLHVRRREDVVKCSQELQVLPQLPQNKAADAPVNRMQCKCLLNKEQLQQSKSLIEQIRAITDSNLQSIHQGVQQHLYDALGLDPRWLDQVDAFEYGSSKGVQTSGYRYCYDTDNQHLSKSIVEVNRQGQVTRKVTFK